MMSNAAKSPASSASKQMMISKFFSAKPTNATAASAAKPKTIAAAAVAAPVILSAKTTAVFAAASKGKPNDPVEIDVDEPSSSSSSPPPPQKRQKIDDGKDVKVFQESQHDSDPETEASVTQPPPSTLEMENPKSEEKSATSAPTKKTRAPARKKTDNGCDSTPKPKPKRQRNSKSKKAEENRDENKDHAPAAEDDDGREDQANDDDEEENSPAPKRKTPTAKASSSKSGKSLEDNFGRGSEGVAGESTIVDSAFLAKFVPTKNTREITASGKKVAYTPLEQQYITFKQSCPDAVLLVECGYRFKFFGEDADIASKELNIFAYMDHNFLTCSVPTHRLSVHVRRLVNQGYKVGVVRQTETAALKSVGENKSGLFTRKLEHIYTKATLVGEDFDTLVDPEEGTLAAESTYLMCIVEAPATNSDQTDATNIGIVAVCPSTGHIVYDNFTDSLARFELESRLVHLRPSELLVSGEISDRTERFIAKMRAACQKEEAIRLDRSNKNYSQTEAIERLTSFFDNEKNSNLVDKIVFLPATTIVCFAVLVDHLTTFGLEAMLKLKGNVESFTSSQHMRLPAATVENLELFKNQTDGSNRGSLLSVLHHTCTSFGTHTLRRWIAQPLQDVKSIHDRQEVVAALVELGNLSDVRSVLTKLPDLDRLLARAAYKKCSPPEFVALLRAFDNVSKEFQLARAKHFAGVEVPLLNQLINGIASGHPYTLELLSSLNAAAATKDGNKADLFTNLEEHPKIRQGKDASKAIVHRFQQHLMDVRKLLKLPDLEYVTVSLQEYMVEIKNTMLAKVPATWERVNATKQVTRFRSPQMNEYLKELNVVQEQLVIDSNQDWQDLLTEFSQHYDNYRSIVSSIATFDCLLSLASVASQDGYVRPTVDAGTPRIQCVAARHPMVDAMSHKQFVPNDVSLNGSKERAFIITGPNMGGKSCYIRQVALLAVMAQVGSWVPAESCEIGVLDGIYIRMGAGDEIQKGNSTFMVEMMETSEILRSASHKSLVILDELGRGTSTHDGVAIAYASMHYVVSKIQCLLLFVTHYPVLGELELRYPGLVANYHMAFMESDDASGQEAITFLYQLTRGVAHRSYGLNVARLAALPKELIAVAREKSTTLEAIVTKRTGISESLLLVARELFAADLSHEHFYGTHRRLQNVAL